MNSRLSAISCLLLFTSLYSICDRHLFYIILRSALFCALLTRSRGWLQFTNVRDGKMTFSEPKISSVAEDIVTLLNKDIKWLHQLVITAAVSHHHHHVYTHTCEPAVFIAIIIINEIPSTLCCWMAAVMMCTHNRPFFAFFSGHSSRAIQYVPYTMCLLA